MAPSGGGWYHPGRSAGDPARPIPVPHSSRGPGHRPLKAEITGSNPVCGTKFATSGSMHAWIGPFVCLRGMGEPLLEPLSPVGMNWPANPWHMGSSMGGLTVKQYERRDPSRLADPSQLDWARVLTTNYWVGRLYLWMLPVRFCPRPCCRTERCQDYPLGRDASTRCPS